ncbi:MAG TPA: hypothetical protein PLA39_09240, partial [Methanoculleus sp.]|nr:hypothetical protein [Methanoculleus sp.]
MDPREPQVFPGLTAGGLHTLAVVEMGEVLSPNSRFHPPGQGGGQRVYAPFPEHGREGGRAAASSP